MSARVWIRVKWQKTIKLSYFSYFFISIWTYEKWFLNVNTAHIKCTYFFPFFHLFAHSQSLFHSHVRHCLVVIIHFFFLNELNQNHSVFGYTEFVCATITSCHVDVLHIDVCVSKSVSVCLFVWKTLCFLPEGLFLINYIMESQT